MPPSCEKARASMSRRVGSTAGARFTQRKAKSGQNSACVTSVSEGKNTEAGRMTMVDSAQNRRMRRLPAIAQVAARPASGRSPKIRP